MAGDTNKGNEGSEECIKPVEHGIKGRKKSKVTSPDKTPWGEPEVLMEPTDEGWEDFIEEKNSKNRAELLDRAGASSNFVADLIFRNIPDIWGTFFFKGYNPLRKILFVIGVIIFILTYF